MISNDFLEACMDLTVSTQDKIRNVPWKKRTDVQVHIHKERVLRVYTNTYFDKGKEIVQRTKKFTLRYIFRRLSWQVFLACKIVILL